MQARFYLPMYGRFASPDPARDQHFEQTQSWNIYSYCMNNPVMAIDPDGQATYMLYWGSGVSHGAIATDIRDSSGRPTGRVMVAGKWPGSGGQIGDYGKSDAKRERDDGTGAPGTIVGGEMSLADLLLGDGKSGINPLTGESGVPDAALRIETSPEQDAKLGAELRQDLKNEKTPDYKGKDDNCATYVKDKAQSVGIKTGSGKESVSVKGKSVTIDTPNRVVRGTMSRNPDTTKLIKGKKETLQTPSI